MKVASGSANNVSMLANISLLGWSVQPHHLMSRSAQRVVMVWVWGQLERLQTDSVNFSDYRIIWAKCCYSVCRFS